MLRSRSTSPKAPEKGSFPLDHFSECTDIFKNYMLCLKNNNNDNRACKLLSKEYLVCRMEHGLMAKEDIDTLGFSDNHIKPLELTPTELEIKRQNSERGKNGYIGGLALLGKIKKGD